MGMNELNYVLNDDWNDIKDIIIFGMGRVCERILPKLKRDFRISAIIDNYTKLSSYEGMKIYKIKDLDKRKLLQKKIVVTTSQNAFESIKKELEILGLKENEHFCRIEDFMIEWYWKNRNEVCIPQITSSITSCCTFKCKKCATLMPYFKKHYSYSLTDILLDLKLLFNKIDYVASYFLIGGEPFLNPLLANIINGVCEMYEEKIGGVQIISNGTIVPDSETLGILKKYNVQVRLSDYTRTINYSNRLKEVLNVLENNKINYSINNYEKWIDLGFPDENIDYGNDKKIINEHMKLCSTGCHALNDGKLFYCGTLFYAEKSGLFQLKKGDFIDLREEIKDKTELEHMKYKIMKYCKGDISDSYISLCRHCRGFGIDNNYVCNVAEQIGTEKNI